MRFINKLSILILAMTVLGGCASGRTAYDKGQKYESSGDLDQAVIKYAEASTANPEISEYRLRFLKACSAAAQIHMTKGNNFAAVKNYGDALREYQTAFALEPSLESAKQHAEKVNNLLSSQLFFKEGEEFENNRKTREALRSYKKALDIDPANKEAKESIERITKSIRPKLEGFELNLKSTKPITLKFKDAKIKEVFTIITKLSGINFIFDEAVKDSSFSIYLENGTFYQALDVITELNKLDKKILNESNVIIYPKNPEKKKQYEELYLQTYYLNKMDAKKAINLLRTMMQIKKIYVNEEMNAIVIRDTPEVIALAGKILEANDIPDAEVVLEVEVIELSKNNAENLGFLLSRYAISAQGFNNGTAFSDVLSTSTTTATTTTTAASPSNLLQLFQYKQFGGFLTVPNATYNFGKTLSNGETLSNPKMRIKNKEKAKFNVGTRVPITTTSSPTGGGISVNVQYVDVGVKLNAEPTIQLNNEISIKLSMEVSSILSRDTVGGTGSATTVVTIGTRNLDTVLSLKDGETSIIGGLIQDSKNKSTQKVSILGEIPVLGSIFSSHDDTNNKTELILAITPRIIRSLVVPEQSVTAFWSGKEDEPSTIRNYTSFNQELEFTPATAAAESAAASPATGSPTAGMRVEETAQSPAGLDTRRRRRPSGGWAVTPQAPVSATPQATAPVPPPVSVLSDSTSVAVQTQSPVPDQPSAVLPPSVPVTMAGKASLKILAPTTVKVNDIVRIEVLVADVNNMYNEILTVQFDSALMDLVGAEEGGFMKQDGKPTSFQHVLNNDEGRVNLNLYRIGNIGGVSGSGTLAVLTFKAKSKGVVNLGLSNAYILAPGGSQPISADLYGSAIEIQ